MGLLHSHGHGGGHGHGHSHGHDHDHHDHDHDRPACEPQGPIPDAGNALAWALALNFAFLVIEVIVGVLSGSIAVMSDAGHMVADVAALAIAYVAQRLSRVRGSAAYTFGWRRLPILGGLANALTLNGIVILIVIVAIQRMSAPPHVEGAPVLAAGVIGLIVNVVGAWILWKRGGGGVNVRGALMHLIADALGSIGVIISGAVLASTGFTLIDPIMSVLIAVLIAAGTWPLLRDLVRTLLLGTPAQIDIDAVRAVFTGDTSVRCLEDFHVWELDTDYVVLSARVHATLDSLESADALVKRISAKLKHDFRIHHVTIEVGPHHEGDQHGENDCLGAA